MKKLLIVTILLALLVIPRIHAEPIQKLDCPAGSYNAGGFCKNEPTGCPYGDSIPVDSPKCVAPPVLEQTPIPVTPVIDTPIVTEVWGK